MIKWTWHVDALIKKRVKDPYRHTDKIMTIQFWRPQSPTLGRDALDYAKLYHTVKRERHNVDGNSEENIDASEHISDKLWLENNIIREKSRYTRNNSQSDSSDYAALTSSSLRGRDLNQINSSRQKQVAYAKQLDKLRNQAIEETQGLGNQKYNGNETVKIYTTNTTTGFWQTNHS